MPRTLLVLADYLDPERPGGSARFAWETARALAARGHDVRLAAGLGVPRAPHAERGFQAAWFPYPPRGRFPPARLWRLARDVRTTACALLSGTRPDAVIAHQPLVARLALRRPGLRDAPLVYVFHSPWHREYELNAGVGLPGVVPPSGLARLRVVVGSWLRRRLEAGVLRRAARMATLSEAMAREAAAAHGVEAARFARLPGGVDLSRYRPAPQAPSIRSGLGLPESGTLVVAARRLVPRMGLAPLLEAFAALADELPRAHLAVCGTGPLEVELRRRAAELRLDGRVTLCGHVPEEHLPDLLRAADLVVAPSAALEGFCLSLLEALACGVPVLATPVGGMVEVLGALDDRCLAAGTDPPALAEGMRRLLRDPGLLRDLGRRGAALVAARYGWDRAAECLATLVEEALA